MKNSIIYKLFFIIFTAFILFECANIKIDYHSTIKYRLKLSEMNREKIETQTFIMSENLSNEDQLKTTFKNSYNQQGYDIHLLIKKEDNNNYDIVAKMVETDYLIPKATFRNIITYDDIQNDLSVDIRKEVDTEYSLGKFSDETIQEFEKMIDNTGNQKIHISYKQDENGNIIGLRHGLKEYYAKTIDINDVIKTKWNNTVLSGYTSKRLEYKDSIVDGEITLIRFDEYYNACIKMLNKILPNAQYNQLYNLDQENYFEYKDGIIVYDNNYAATFYNQSTTINDQELVKADVSNYLVYDFYYIDTTTLSKDVKEEMVTAKAPAYFVMTLLAFIVSYLLSKILTKHIKTITEVTNKISNNDFSSKIPVKSNDELGILSTNINNMSDRLKETIDNLHNEIENVKYLEGVRKEFIANFTHEIKTPLAIINGYIELLSKTNDNNKREEYLDAINKETNRMNTMIINMLELSQLEAGRKELKVSEIFMDECITDVVDDYLPLIKNKSIQLHLDIDQEVFDGDQEEIKKVISNFMSNAIKHTKENGYIHIKFKEGIFSIENEGEPISEEQKKVIFETYVSQDRNGTGLGLAICKAILELHQFKYGVENTDRGVKFYFEV